MCSALVTLKNNSDSVSKSLQVKDEDGILKMELWTDPAYLTLTLISDFPVHSCSFKIIPTRSRDVMFIQTTF